MAFQLLDLVLLDDELDVVHQAVQHFSRKLCFILLISCL